MKTHFKVWLTRCALTDGIKEATAYPYGTQYMVVSTPGGGEDLEANSDCHITKEAAIACANEMRKVKIASIKKKIDSLNKQIAKLEAMRFE